MLKLSPEHKLLRLSYTKVDVMSPNILTEHTH